MPAGFSTLPAIASGLNAIAGGLRNVGAGARGAGAALAEMRTQYRPGEAIPPGSPIEPSFMLNQQTPAWFASQSPQEQTNRLLGAAPGTPPGQGVPSIPTTSLPGRAGPAWGELQSPQDILRSRGMQGPAGLEEGNAFADVLDAAADRFDAGFPNGYFSAVVLRMEIPYLRIGARSVAEVRLYIQSFAPFFLPGFQKAVLDPGLSPLERSLTNEAIRILMSGSVSAGGGGGGGALTIPTHRVPTPAGELTLGPRTAAPPTAGTPGSTTTSARTTAGGASDTKGIESAVVATNTRIAALGASLTQHTQSVLDRLRQVQVDVHDPALQQRVLDRLREVQSDFRSRLDPQHLFQPLIDGQLRPMRQEIRETITKGVAQTRELSMALERLELSGALTGARQ